VKLIISELAARRRYVSREFAYIITELVEHYGWRQIETYDLLDVSKSLKDHLREKLGGLPETILFWEGYYLLNARPQAFSDLDCRKYILCDDLHWWGDAMRRDKHEAFSLCETIFSTYGYIFDQYYPEFSNTKNIVWIPHSASPDFLLPYNEHPENVILLSGAINKHYPLRQQMRELYDAGLHRIVYDQHPGYHCEYDYEKSARVGRAYAGRINSCRAAFTDSLTYKYTVAKYFEIPATGALLLADCAVSEPLKEIGFLEWVHYVPVSSRDLECKVRYVLDENNHDEVDGIRRRGQELVRQRHKSSDRAKLIDEICARPAQSAEAATEGSATSSR
jgi:hypothetical protein